MVNPEWDNASTDKKLEMLRADIGMISDAHSTLSRDHRALLDRANRLEAEIEQLRRQHMLEALSTARS